MDDKVQLNPEQVRSDIRQLEQLIRRADEEGGAEAMAAKRMFQQLIQRHRRRLEANA